MPRDFSLLYVHNVEHLSGPTHCGGHMLDVVIACDVFQHSDQFIC